MGWYGFRLYNLELRERARGRTPIKVEQCGAEHLADHLERLLETRLLERTFAGPPPSDAQDPAAAPVESVGEAEPIRPQTSTGLRVIDVDRDGYMVRATVYYGRYSDFKVGLRLPGSEDPDPALDGIAPARSYRVIFNLPAKGTTGVLVVEDCSRSHPTKMLIGYLRLASQQASIEAALKEHTDDAEAAEKAAGKGNWWRLDARPMADPEHLQNLIEQGRLERIQLTRKAYGRDNAKSSAAWELSVKDLSEASRNRVLEHIKGWLPTKDKDGKETKVTDADAAKQLAALLGESVEDLGFDDGYVVIEDAGKSKQLSPSRLSDYFIYPISQDRQPLDLAFYERARDTAMRVAKATGTTSLEWPPIV